MAGKGTKQCATNDPAMKLLNLAYLAKSEWRMAKSEIKDAATLTPLSEC